MRDRVTKERFIVTNRQVEKLIALLLVSFRSYVTMSFM